jgi:hypothetical protein
MQKVASGLLGEFTQGSVIYVAMTSGNGPKDDPGKPVETKYPFNATVRGVKFSYIDNTQIVSSDLQITIPADVITPQMTGYVLIDDVKHKIIKIIPKPAAGVPAVYVLIVRK